MKKFKEIVDLAESVETYAEHECVKRGIHMDKKEKRRIHAVVMSVILRDKKNHDAR